MCLVFQRELRRITVGVCLATALIAIAGGCSTGKKVRSMFGGLLPMQVQVAEDVNEDSPVAVDLVIVYNQKLVDSLLKMPASEWFSKREQMLKDHPQDLFLQSWEWVPGQDVEPQSISYRLGARKVLLFADYRTDGDHRAAIEPQQPFRLVLGPSDLAVEIRK